MTVAPPITAGGIVDTSAPTLGIRPASIKNAAPTATTYLLMIFVNAIIPTFWLNEVFGNELKIADSEDVKPLAMTEPESSFSVGSLPAPPVVIAVTSPTVSTDVTINMIIIGR